MPARRSRRLYAATMSLRSTTKIHSVIEFNTVLTQDCYDSWFRETT